MSDDPRVTVPADEWERFRDVVMDEGGCFYEDAYRAARALVDAAERPDEGPKRVAGAVGYGWSGEEIFEPDDAEPTLAELKAENQSLRIDLATCERLAREAAEHMAPAPPPVPVSDEREKYGLKPDDPDWMLQVAKDNDQPGVSVKWVSDEAEAAKAWQAEKEEIYAAHAQLIANQRRYHEAEVRRLRNELADLRKARAGNMADAELHGQEVVAGVFKETADALLDRAERAEAELAALRAAVTAKAESCEREAAHWTDRGEAQSGDNRAKCLALASKYSSQAAELRSLLAAAPTETEETPDE